MGFSKVYIVTANVNDFAMLQESVLEMSLQVSEEEPLQFYGDSLINHWRTMDVEWLEVEGEKALPKPDIAAWGATIFAVPSVIADEMSQLKERAEFLPLNLNGQSWFALNVIKKLDAIDESKTKFNLRNGRPSRTRPFNKLVLKKDAISDEMLFRVNGAGLRLFCTDQPGGLFELVNKLNLKGLVFKEVELA
ncbi:imm11 family protein [Vibrio vulnificus]|uniref:imm11 family protein n=1 Tax=Vibrio vulnificus TaxID=672 RepID=UPI000C7C0AA1|nr:DUF1629 domain-containing protein [Vibrio vulnificus]AUL98701.1 hypothetical protein FORC54_p012 [Vibrio vulnificus]ELV8742472.1 hypothetical protein [Vibrio vulnificus]